MNAKENSVSVLNFMVFDNISRHPKFDGRLDLLNAMAEFGERLQERQFKMSEHDVFFSGNVKTRCHGELGKKRPQSVV